MKYILLIFIILFLNIEKEVHATVYHAVPEQTNSDPEHTAFMFKLDLKNPYKHRIIAVSRDLLPIYPNGTKVYISGTAYDGVYTVRDKMNKRYKNRIDILINKNMKIGKWENAKIRKLWKQIGNVNGLTINQKKYFMLVIDFHVGIIMNVAVVVKNLAWIILMIIKSSYIKQSHQ